MSRTAFFIQLLTLLLVVLGYFVDYYSQKSLIDYKEELTSREPRLVGSAVHAFLDESSSRKDSVSLTQVSVFREGKWVGDTVKLDLKLIVFPVYIGLTLENQGNALAKNVRVTLSIPEQSILHGELVFVSEQYNDCNYLEPAKTWDAVVKCDSLKQGEKRSFNYLWLPRFQVQDVEDYVIKNEGFTFKVDTSDLIEFEVVADNSEKAFISERALASETQ